MSMHTPCCPRRHASLLRGGLGVGGATGDGGCGRGRGPGGGGGGGGGGVGVAFASFRAVGQHLMAAPPGQNPLRTSAPVQVKLPVSMQAPGCPCRHASFGGGGGGGVGGGVLVLTLLTLLASSLPAWQPSATRVQSSEHRPRTWRHHSVPFISSAAAAHCFVSSSPTCTLNAASDPRLYVMSVTTSCTFQHMSS